METTNVLKWINSEKTGKWEIANDQGMEDFSLPLSTPQSSEAGSAVEGPSAVRGGGCGRGNGNLVGNSDEPLLPLFPCGHDPHDSSSLSDSSNNPRRRCGQGRIPPLPPGGSTMYSGSVRGCSAGQRYEKYKCQMKIPIVFKGDPSDHTLPYWEWFHSVENYMKWHRTDCEHDTEKIISIGGVTDGDTGTWYNARAEYMKQYFKVDKWNPFVSAMKERFLDRQEERNALGNMREPKYKGDIESYLTDMDTLNYKVCLVGNPWRTMVRDGLAEDLPYHLSTTKRKPRNDIDYVESVQRVVLSME